MEHLSPNLVTTSQFTSRWSRTTMFHLFNRIGFLCHCAVRPYVLRTMLAQTKYDLLHLPRTDSRTGEIVFCLIVLDPHMEVIGAKGDLFQRLPLVFV